MRAKPKTKPLTFGALVEHSYETFGNRRAKGMLRLASQAHLIMVSWVETARVPLKINAPPP